ncbi:MAG TPA: hypothetical protein VFJ85_03465 [Acidimicrobiales bacterium]|nr:hypothetical protein [Acidimicrobiales bacterium]
MDHDEFVRRIEVYLKLDLPEVEEARSIAEALGERLFQYLRQPPVPLTANDSLLEALLPSNALLFFRAAWDGNSQKYRPIVQEVAGPLGRLLVEIDVDDLVGGAIAAAYSVRTTPAAAVGLPARGRVVVGVRAADELVSRLTP